MTLGRHRFRGTHKGWNDYYPAETASPLIAGRSVRTCWCQTSRGPAALAFRRSKCQAKNRKKPRRHRFNGCVWSHLFPFHRLFDRALVGVTLGRHRFRGTHRGWNDYFPAETASPLIASRSVRICWCQTSRGPAALAFRRSLRLFVRFEQNLLLTLALTNFSLTGRALAFTSGDPKPKALGIQVSV